MKEESLNSEVAVSDRMNRYSRKEKIVFGGLVIALVVVVLISLPIGRYGIPIRQLFEIVWELISGQGVSEANAEAKLVLSVIRIPRILMTIMVGMALSASGATFQGIFRNPMVSPDILGVSSAAGTGAAIGILLSFSSFGINISAFLFGIAAVALVMLIAKAFGRGRGSLLVMVLSGLVVTYIFRAVTSLMKYLADGDNKLPEITFWLMGTFARSGSYRNVIIMLVVLVLGAGPLLALRWKMNVLSFGEEEARAMGVDTKRLRLILIACSTLLTATSVCLCGSIEWLGLIIPHIARFLVGANQRILLPVSMLGGSVFLVIVDNLCRAIIPGELPLSIVTSLIGAPLFIFMLFKNRSDIA